MSDTLSLSSDCQCRYRLNPDASNVFDINRTNWLHEPLLPWYVIIVAPMAFHKT